MRNFSLGRRHLVNAYEVKAGIGVIAGNTVWSMPERLECEVPTTKSALYKYTYLLPFTQAFEWYHFQWPLTTSKPAKMLTMAIESCHHIRQDWGESQQRYEIHSHNGKLMTPSTWGVILNDHERLSEIFNDTKQASRGLSARLRQLSFLYAFVGPSHGDWCYGYHSEASSQSREVTEISQRSFYASANAD